MGTELDLWDLSDKWPKAREELLRLREDNERYRKALATIAKPPFMWDSPPSRDTDEVRFRCRVARTALHEEAKP
jgi:hypothetical protein